MICICGCQNCEKKVKDIKKNKKGNKSKHMLDRSTGCKVHKRANLYCKDCKTAEELPGNNKSLLSRNSSDGGSIKSFQKTYANFGPNNGNASQSMKRSDSGLDLKDIGDDDNEQLDNYKVVYCTYCESKCNNDKDPYQIYSKTSKNPK